MEKLTKESFYVFFRRLSVRRSYTGWCANVYMAMDNNRNVASLLTLYINQPFQHTVVDLSTRTAFLNIDQSLQFRNFWSQSKALFMIRCMLSAESGSKTFWIHFYNLTCIYLYPNAYFRTIKVLFKEIDQYSKMPF